MVYVDSNLFNYTFYVKSLMVSFIAISRFEKYWVYFQKQTNNLIKVMYEFHIFI